MSAEFHISSLVVRAHPRHVDAVCRIIENRPGAEIHAVENGKIVVTLETATEGEVAAALTDFTLLDGVMSAVMVFHHVERIDERSREVPPC